MLKSAQEYPRPSIMTCKLQLHSLSPMTGRGANDETLTGASVRFGAVWEGSTEKQQASESAVFGHWTPYAEFSASILNQHVVDQLVQGKKYYLTFTEAPD
jgi:hypothetical protein